MQVASLIKDGGVVALAMVVLWHLRALSPVLVKIENLLTALLERERMRAERSLQKAPPMYADAASEFPDDETPPLGTVPTVPARERARTPGGGVRATTHGEYGPLKPRGGG